MDLKDKQAFTEAAELLLEINRLLDDERLEAAVAAYHHLAILLNDLRQRGDQLLQRRIHDREFLTALAHLDTEEALLLHRLKTPDVNA